MIIYLNWLGPDGRETVDEIDSKSFESIREFRVYVRYLINEYRLAGMDVYKSSRPCGNWSSENE